MTAYVASHALNEGTYPSLAVLVRDISAQVTQYGSIARMPAETVGNTRNDMYLASEAIRFLMKDQASDLSPAEIKTLNAYKLSLDEATKFIPTWVKIAVAIALGLGTMIGWKRIVVTVGEKIGKTHLTYAQGACAEITAAATIAAADVYGLPVSTTHVLSSGIAGTMAANGSGLQLSTVRNIALAWVLTLPAAMVISGTLYWAFSSCSELQRRRTARLHSVWKRATTSSGMGCDLIMRRIGRIARCPNAGLATFDGERAAHNQPMLDIEARPAELADLRRQLHDVAESCRSEEAGADVDQRNADDAEGAGQVEGFDAQRGLEERPRPPVEEFEETAIEYDACRIAVTPFDRKLPLTEEMGHGAPLNRRIEGVRVKQCVSWFLPNFSSQVFYYCLWNRLRNRRPYARIGFKMGAARISMLVVHKN